MRANRKASSTFPFLTLEEQQILLNFKLDRDSIGVRNQCLISLILASALFAEEIVNLTINALQLQQGKLFVTGEGERERCITLDLTVCEQACKNWLRIRQKVLAGHFHDSLFLNYSGQPLTKRGIYKIISQMLLKAGIQKETHGPELLRQSAICRMFKNHYTLENVQMNTGIKTLAQLERYRQAAAQM